MHRVEKEIEALIAELEHAPPTELKDDMTAALEEIKNARTGGDCHELTIRLITVPTDQLPKFIPHTIEPAWLKALHQIILKLRLEKGV